LDPEFVRRIVLPGSRRVRAAREKKVTRELLADAARAEFRYFSSFVAPATAVNRP
jgi:hypothetical protein